jgi:N-acetylneuraminic acid mutarotase
MKTVKPILVASLIFAVMTSCRKFRNSSSTVNPGNWLTKSSYKGAVRSEAVTFVINDTGYIGTGYDGNIRLSDIWAFNATADYWYQKADFGGSPRNSAVAFEAAGKGYITTGYDGLNMLNDTWEYDDTANSWTQKASFPGTRRYDAVGFGILDKGYVGTGFDGTCEKDFWQYDPVADAWTQTVGFGGNKRTQAVVFVHNNIAYVATGVNNGIYESDFWSFNPSTSSWTQLRSTANVNTETYDYNYGNIDRANAVAIVIGDSAYLTTGEQPGLTNTCWGYDFATDLWFTKTAYEGVARTGATGLSVNEGGYVGLGRSSTLFFDDWRQFFPWNP